jgi:hypothetical protein
MSLEDPDEIAYKERVREERYARKHAEAEIQHDHYRLCYRMRTNGACTTNPSMDPTNTKFGNTVIDTKFASMREMVDYIKTNPDESKTHNRLYGLYGICKNGTVEYIHSLSYNCEGWQKISRDIYKGVQKTHYKIYKKNINGNLVKMPGDFGNLGYLENYIQGRPGSWWNPSTMPGLDMAKTYYIFLNDDPFRKYSTVKIPDNEIKPWYGWDKSKKPSNKKWVYVEFSMDEVTFEE